jgi:outer membrane protein TolC
MFGYLTTTGLQVLPRNISAGGFLVSWDVFDWGRKKQELAAKSKTIEQAKTAVQATENQVLVEVESRYRKLEESRRLLQVVQLAQEAAREKLRVATNRYEQRTALLRDALQAEASLAEADYQYQQALSSFLTARADFEKAIGEGVSK